MIEPYELQPVRVRAKQYRDTGDVNDLHDLGATVIWTTFGAIPSVTGAPMAQGDWLVKFSDTGALKVYSDVSFQARFRKVGA